MFKELNSLKLFFEKPTRWFNTREVARLLKIAPATASKELKRLSKLDLLNERKERMLNLYSANLDNEYKDVKVYYNIRKLKESGLIDALNQFYLKPKIILFGSCAYGLDVETSDFDLLIVSEKLKDFPSTKLYEKKINRALQIFVVKEIKDLKNNHLINNVLNGINIQGQLKWI